jgi:hypothetical protein
MIPVMFGYYIIIQKEEIGSKLLKAKYFLTQVYEEPSRDGFVFSGS